MSIMHNGEKVLNNITSVNEEAMKEIAKEVYSTEEKVVGTWIDGNPIYRKVIDCGFLLDRANKTIPHGITNLKIIIDIRGIAHCDGVVTQNLPLPFPYSNVTDTVMNSVPIYMWEESGNIVIKPLSNRTTYYSYVILTYTKTTD